MAMSASVSPALEKLEVLVGDWVVELRFSADQPNTVMSKASFQWIEDGSFLSYRLGEKAAGLPHAVFLIGGDDSTSTYTALYTDDRRVSRVYQMRLEERVWTMWRDAPGFWQRFQGTLDDAGDTIGAQWERSVDGASWQHDFYLTYRRLVA
jgi:hypothetical protein